jgi:hypothetical protein
MVNKNVLRTLNVWTMILVLSMFILPSIYGISAAPWADASELYRQEINITGASVSIDNLTHTFVIDSSNVGASFDFTNDRDSVRFYYFNSTSNVSSLIPHYASTWSVVDLNATLMIKVPYLDASSDANLFMYYHDSTKSNSENYCSVFIYCDDFADASIDSRLSTVDLDTVAGTSFSEGSGVLTVIAGGSDTWTGTDHYGSVYLTGVSGDVDVRLEVTSQTNPNVWAKAGIMLKNDMTAAASSTGYSFNVRTPGNGYSFQRDMNDNGYLDTNNNGGAPSVSPSYVRLVKSGNTHTGYYSKTTPNAWTLITSSSITSTNNIQDIGISLTSHAGSTLCTATFDDFTVRRYSTDTFSEIFGNEDKLTNYLSSVVNDPSILAITNMVQNKTFVFNSSVSCFGIDNNSDCGNVSANLKYNSSSVFSSVATSSSIPVWSISSNPQSCNLLYNSSCTFTWTVNATGIVGSIHKLNVLYSSNVTDILNKTSKNASIKIINGDSVNFNQSFYDFSSFDKNSGDREITLEVISDNGDNTNLVVSCESGDCSLISDNWLDGINLNEGISNNIEFTCSDSSYGDYSAIFSVTSDEYDDKSLINVSCFVNPIYGPINVYLTSPTPLSTKLVGQNRTFSFDSYFNCTGLCGNVSAYAVYSSSSWWNPAWSYRQELNISISDAIPLGYQILLNLTSSTIGSNFDWSNNCNDVRILNGNTELNYWIETCNSTTENLYVWIESDSAFASSSNYILDLYYGNFWAVSNSNASSVFSSDLIHLTAGRCPASDGACNYLDNIVDGQTIRANIGAINWDVDGTGYVSTINNPDNPYSGIDDNFYLRYRALYIPSVTGTYWFGTASDDGSNAGLWSYDGYGYGLSTPTSLSNHDIVTDWYGAHGSGTCGATAGIERSRTLNDGFGYWIDYVMQEVSGGQDSEFCVDLPGGGTNYLNFNDVNFGGDFYARTYVENEPLLDDVSLEESLIISTDLSETPFWTSSFQPQSCIPIEDGTCPFSWTVNATGAINSSWNISVFYVSNLSSILPNQTLYTTINITDNIEPVITLYNPLNVTKILGNGSVEFLFKVDDDSSILNCSFYLDDVLNQSFNCNSGTNYSLNLSFYPGNYDWYVNVIDEKYNSVNSSKYEFWMIYNQSARVSKSIRNINTNMYFIEVNISNSLSDFTSPISVMNYVDSDVSSGSYSVIYDWINVTIGYYVGDILGWDLIVPQLVSREINYSVSGIDDYYLGREFMVGLD